MDAYYDDDDDDDGADDVGYEMTMMSVRRALSRCQNQSIKCLSVEAS